MRHTKLGPRGFQRLNLSGVDLTGADLQDAQLTNADLSHANLTDANLTGASLQGVIASTPPHRRDTRSEQTQLMSCEGARRPELPGVPHSTVERVIMAGTSQLPAMWMPAAGCYSLSSSALGTAGWPTVREAAALVRPQPCIQAVARQQRAWLAFFHNASLSITSNGPWRQSSTAGERWRSRSCLSSGTDL